MFLHNWAQPCRGLAVQIEISLWSHYRGGKWCFHLTYIIWFVSFSPQRVMSQIVQQRYNPFCSQASTVNANYSFTLNASSLCLCLQTANYVHTAWLKKHKDDTQVCKSMLVAKLFGFLFYYSSFCAGTRSDLETFQLTHRICLSNWIHPTSPVSSLC